MALNLRRIRGMHMGKMTSTARTGKGLGRVWAIPTMILSMLTMVPNHPKTCECLKVQQTMGNSTADLLHLWIEDASEKKRTLLRVIPTLTHYSDSFCHIIWKYVRHIYVLTFFLAFYYTWHLFWHSIWHSIWHLFWQSFWHSIWNLFWHMLWHSIWLFLWHVCSGVRERERVSEGVTPLLKSRDPRLAGGVKPIPLPILGQFLQQWPKVFYEA